MRTIPTDTTETINQILDLVCIDFKIPRMLLTASHYRAQKATMPRMLANVALRRFTPLSTKEIGYVMNRDHTTVIHHLQQARLCPWIEKKLDNIETALLHHLPRLRPPEGGP